MKKMFYLSIYAAITLIAIFSVVEAQGRLPCWHCNGSGICTFCEGTGNCNSCNGTGAIVEGDYVVNDEDDELYYSEHHERCNDCYGSGQCQECSGNGQCHWCWGSGFEQF